MAKQRARRGNPYRDARGRFTSRTGAIKTLYQAKNVGAGAGRAVRATRRATRGGGKPGRGARFYAQNAPKSNAMMERAIAQARAAGFGGSPRRRKRGR